MDKIKKKEYIKSGGTICPFCDSNNIGAVTEIEQDEIVISQLMQCNDCGKRWEDIYKLHNIKEVVCKKKVAD